jgi:hypothetical protein
LITASMATTASRSSRSSGRIVMRCSAMASMVAPFLRSWFRRQAVA